MSPAKNFVTHKIYQFLFAICIIFVPVIGLASSADQKAMEGMDLYKQNAFDKASQKFLEAHQGKPNDPKISYNLGNSQYKEGKFDEALKDYSRLLDDKTDTAIKQKSAYNIGNTLFRMNKLEESINAYKKALDLDPSDMDAKFNLEFVRKKKDDKQKKEHQEKNQSKNNGKDKESKNEKNQNQNQNKNNQQSQNKTSNTLNEKKPSFQDKQEIKNSRNNPSIKPETFEENMTKEEANRKLSSLTEDLKKFQRRQALEMKSIFNYQGNDW